MRGSSPEYRRQAELTPLSFQRRTASNTIATTNGAMSKTTLERPTDAVCSASSKPTAKRTASQRGTRRLRHKATPMMIGARYSLNA